VNRWLKNKRPTWCHLLFFFTSYVLNMFRILIYPSSGACDYSVELPHLPYCSWFDVCWSFGVFGLEWYPCCRLKPATRIPLQIKYQVKLNIEWHQVGLLFFNYHNDARSNKHKIHVSRWSIKGENIFWCQFISIFPAAIKKIKLKKK